MDEQNKRPCWFVGASYEGATDDQTSRFVHESMWENGYTDRYLDLVGSIEVGDRIAIKSTYTRKNNLSFDNRGHTVSVMGIKAIGVVTENLGDGRTLKVQWSPIGPRREWYFYTNRNTVWRVEPGEWRSDDLIAFTFEERQQNIDQFRNAPYWRDRFGDVNVEDLRFGWTRFYEALADKLLSYRNRRDELVSGINAIAKQFEFSYLNDRFDDGTSGPMLDICPFTIIGMFNRGIRDDTRKAVAEALDGLLEIEVAVPDEFQGIPVLNNQKSWFFGYHRDRNPNDIDTLWEVFERAIRFADLDDDDARAIFVTAYDRAASLPGVNWNLTIGLYWIRPWVFATLDSRTRSYIVNNVSDWHDANLLKGQCNATEYLDVVDALVSIFDEHDRSFHSFPELSLAAWMSRASDEVEETEIECPAPQQIESYTVDNILTDGCFIGRERLEEILDRLAVKKNLILQGAPGTGKSWLARRLAFASIGQRDESKVRAVQFHPNLTYEDFVRGWRPDGDGKLSLLDGPFVEMIARAKSDQDSTYVFVIEEINRGNPAQIFGEMLTLIELDKRTPGEALELSYRRRDRERVFVPRNLLLIGTMNVADRSLALVDLALRRRFAFVELEPTLGRVWRDWVHTNNGIEQSVLMDIERRMNELNQFITDDLSLGPQFRVGHSYVTPPSGTQVSDARIWFRQVVETEIGPLLDEYWFDALHHSRKARAALLDGF